MTQDIIRYISCLYDCSFFEGMDNAMLLNALDALDAEIVYLEKDETIYRPGDELRRAAVVLEGAVFVQAEDAEEGGPLLNILHPGQTYGAAAAVAGHSLAFMLRVYAGTPCVILTLDITLLQHMDYNSEVHRRLLENLMHSFAERCVELYNRVQIYGKKRIRSRIRMYLLSLPRRNDTVLLPLSRTALSAYLGVDRTAMARELSRMQEEGLISINKRRVRLLSQEEFPLSPADAEKE